MKKPLTLEDRRHGSASTYFKYKCRCEPCAVAAKASYTKKNAKRTKRHAEERAKRFNAAPLIEQIQLVSAIQPEIYEKYKGKLGGWTTFGIDVWTADRICIELKMHPVLVFGQVWIDKALEEDDLVHI
jgi:hypothetical protein